MRFTTILALPALLAPFFCLSQIEGNHLYSNQLYGNIPYNHPGTVSTIQNPTSVLQGDTAMVIRSAILLNTKADAFRVTVGVTQDDATVSIANDHINRRINGFRAAMDSIGMRDEDWFVDLVSQVRIYDYEIAGKKWGQVQAGFEVKKNVVMVLRQYSDIEKMMTVASRYEIFDLAKVDHIVLDTQSIYNQMMKVASEVIENRRDQYKQVTGYSIPSTPKVLSENFYSSFPGDHYKDYTAFESSDMKGGDSKTIKEVERKQKTYYYDGISPEAFDKVINGASPIVGVQFVLQLSVLYKIKR